MKKYLNKIEALRAEMRALSSEAQKEGLAIDPRFFEIQKDLDKVWRNLQAWCKRHGADSPAELMKAI